MEPTTLLGGHSVSHHRRQSSQVALNSDLKFIDSSCHMGRSGPLAINPGCLQIHHKFRAFGSHLGPLGDSPGPLVQRQSTQIAFKINI